MKKLMRLIFFFFICISAVCIAQEPAHCNQVMQYVEKQLPHWGILQMTSKGFIYVDVDDAYIHSLISFIAADGFEEPPYFGSGGVGAHITVALPAESKKYGIESIQECGEKINFVPKGCKVVHPPTWPEMEEVYFIEVEAPVLNRIRAQYGLPLEHYDFHITIGIKPKAVQAA